MGHSLLVHGLEKLLKAGEFSSLTMDPAALLGTDDEAEEDEDSSGGKGRWEMAIMPTQYLCFLFSKFKLCQHFDMYIVLDDQFTSRTIT